MIFVILILTFLTMLLIVYAVVPIIYKQTQRMSEKRQQAFSHRMEEVVPRHKIKGLTTFFVLAPVIFAGAFYLLAPEEMRVFGAIIGLVVGFAFPGYWIKTLRRKMQNKFEDQLIDALMIMSSSFRGGLSLIQAIEAVVDEMPDPINREFGIVLGENKMGVSLEEALNHLYNRMPSTALQQMNTSILLARETGGNLPQIFSRIVTNIREMKKIKQNLDTLTIQGKIQGVVMTMLPIAFVSIVFSSNRRIFDNMLNSEMGRMLLIAAAVLWVCGALGIWKISSFKDF
ncbi:MAG: type II secretion system F family protein [Candidatus Omnitrophica bacterium]|nr:type II secretion system F family protein [Candidatus Omnitrophota bacterium]